MQEIHSNTMMYEVVYKNVELITFETARANLKIYWQKNE